MPTNLTVCKRKRRASGMPFAAVREREVTSVQCAAANAACVAGFCTSPYLGRK
jgi:hypothetical protein